jgi:hypothetical protein
VISENENMDRLLFPILLSVALLPSPSHAQTSDAAPSGATNTAAASPVVPLAPALSDAAKPVSWQPEWERFRWWEYAGTAGLLATGFGIRFLGPSPPQEDNVWEFEKDIAAALAIRGSASNTIGTLGDIGYLGTLVYRFVDSALIPSIYWGQPDVAWQMFMMDLESFSITATALWTSQALVGRQRPRFRDCPDEARPGTSCSDTGDNRYRSFIMGHFAVASTGASLTCVHHAHLPLYGGGAADGIACGAHITAAAIVAFSRITGEEHYVSDALLAGSLGFFAGYIVPSALHYGFGGERPGTNASELTGPSRPSLRVALLPFMQESKLGLSAVGLF